MTTPVAVLDYSVLDCGCWTPDVPARKTPIRRMSNRIACLLRLFHLEASGWRRLVSLSLLFMLLCTGCVAQRGVHFGHWAMPSEKMRIIRVLSYQEKQEAVGTERVLLLSTDGDLPADNLVDLEHGVFRGMQNYFPGTIHVARSDGSYSDLADADNIFRADSTVDEDESSRVGRLLGMSHVLCVRVREFRPYPPQVLSIHVTLIDTALSRTVAEISAVFDASEQQVVVAVGDYLQRRRATRYDMQSLDMMLKSPSKYSDFVSDRCLRALAQAVWKSGLLKNEPTNDDNQQQG